MNGYVRCLRSVPYFQIICVKYSRLFIILYYRLRILDVFKEIIQHLSKIGHLRYVILRNEVQCIDKRFEIREFS